MKVRIILNPYANRWKAKKQVPLIRKAFAEAGVEHSIVMTTEPKEATREARDSADKFDAVIAAGGDGTLNEVVNGLVQAAGDGATLPFGILPVGTGNDFADMAELPRDIRQAVRAIVKQKTRPIDIAVATLNNGEKTHYFDNNSALAMEPMVNLEQIALKRLNGVPRYVVATAKALFKLKAWNMSIEWDDGQYTGPTLLVSVCNGPRTGATFLMAPDAKFDDGLLDVIIVPEVKMSRVLQLVPKLITGRHVDEPDVMLVRTTSLKVTSTPPTPIHADGEMLMDAAHTIDYAVLGGKLTLLTP